MSISGKKKRTENGKKRRLIRHCKQNETSSNFFSLFFFWSKNFWESSYRVCFLRKQTRIESPSFLIGDFFGGLWGSPKMSLFLFFLHWKNTVFFGFLHFTLELTLKNSDVFGDFFGKKAPPKKKKNTMSFLIVQNTFWNLGIFSVLKRTQIRCYHWVQK